MIYPSPSLRWVRVWIYPGPYDKPSPIRCPLLHLEPLRRSPIEVDFRSYLLCKWAVIPILAILLVGCSTRKFDLPLPSDSRKLPESEAQQIASSILSNKAPVSVRTLFTGELSAYGRKESSTQALNFERPDRLRFEVFAPGVNQLLFMAVASGREIIAIDLKEKFFVRSFSSREVFEAILDLPLTAYEMMHWISARAFPEFTHCQDVYETAASALIIECRTPWRTMRIKTTRSLLPNFTELSLTGRDFPGLRTEYELTENHTPRKIRFFMKEIKGELTFKRFEANTTLPESLFRVTPPAGFEQRVFRQ